MLVEPPGAETRWAEVIGTAPLAAEKGYPVYPGGPKGPIGCEVSFPRRD